MKRRILLAALGAILAAGTLPAHAQGVPEPKTDFDLGADVRYPKDLKVVPVDDKTPAELKPFAGRWAGQYNGVMNFVVTFEKLASDDDIVYVHSVGITPAYNIMRKLVARPKGAVHYDPATKRILAQFEPTQTQAFSITPEGWLKVEYEEKGTWNSLGYMKRVQDVAGQPSGAPVPAPFKMPETN